MLGGPIFLFDAVRAARRSRLTLLRSLYALFLLVVLFLVYTRWFGRDLIAGLAGIMDGQMMSLNDQPRFAASFFHTFLMVQFFAVFFLTPALTGGAIAEEREKGTLPLLLTTALEGRDILLGKLASRVALLALLVLTGVPILAILQLLGGVDPALLAAGFAVTLLTLISTASIGLYCSASAGRTQAAVFGTYVVLFSLQLVLTLCCGTCLAVFIDFGAAGRPLHFLTGGSFLCTVLIIGELSSKGQLGAELPLLILGQLLAHGTISYYFLRLANDRFRRSGPDRAMGNSSVVVTARAVPPPLHPAVSDRPIVWKELHVDRGVDARDINLMVVLIGMFFVGQLFLMAVIVRISADTQASREFATLHRTILVPLVTCLILLRLALRGARSLSSERDRQTLDSLLMTDLTNEELLREKWLGCWWSQKGMYLVLVPLILVGVCLSLEAVWMLPLLVLGLSVQLVLALNLGMYCSLVCRSTYRATTMTLIGLLALGVGHWLLYVVLSAVGVAFGWPDTFHERLTVLHTYGLTPPINLATLASLVQPQDGFGSKVDARELLLAALGGVMIHAVLAAGLWWRLRARFGPLTGRLR